MEKFNAIKILENEKEIIANKNLGKSDFMQKLENFIQDFIVPKLIKLDSKGMLQYNPTTKDEETFLKTMQLDMEVSDLLNSLALGVEFENCNLIENVSQYENFIYKDKKYKENVADIFCKFLLDRKII